MVDTAVISIDIVFKLNPIGREMKGCGKVDLSLNLQCAESAVGLT